MIWIERFKEHWQAIVTLLFSAWIGFLMVLVMLASAVDGFPKLTKDPPEPPVYQPDEPRRDENGCMRIDGVEICPRDTTGLKGAASSPESVMSKLSEFIFGEQTPFGETRHAPAPEAVKVLKMVADVLQVSKKIDLYGAEFKRGPNIYTPGGYARDLGDKSEIVYSMDGYPNLKGSNKVSWAFIGLMSHEVAHVLFNQNVFDDDWENEASAEYFAGIAIYRLGGHLGDALEYSNRHSGEDDKHPQHSLREILLREGWKQARAQHYNSFDTCRPGLIGHDFRYQGRLCKMAVSCKASNKPIQIACQKPDKRWSWL